MTDSFYVVLPSNTGDLPSNKTSQFTVRLPDALELDSGWTVALASIIYPFSFSMLDEEEGESSSIIIYRRYGQELRSYRVEIPDVAYRDEVAIGNSINSILLDVWEKELHKQGGDYERDAASAKRLRRQLPPEEGELKTPQRIEESEETRKAVEAFLAAKQQQQQTADGWTQPESSKTGQEGELKTVERVEESDEIKQKVQALIDARQKQQQQQSESSTNSQPTTIATPSTTATISQQSVSSQTPLDGTLIPIPSDAPAPMPKGFEPELHEPLLKLAKSASDRAWRKSVEAAKKAQEAQEFADHHYTLARLKYARKDYVEIASGTGEEIQVRKTSEHISEWVREQIEVIKQRKDLVASKAQITVDAATRSAAAKRETDAAVESKDVAEARKAADRAKNALRTAEDGLKQAQEALDELKKISEEVVKKVDTSLYEQDHPTEPVVLPMPPPSPPLPGATPPSSATKMKEEDKKEPTIPDSGQKEQSTISHAIPTIIKTADGKEDQAEKAGVDEDLDADFGLDTTQIDDGTNKGKQEQLWTEYTENDEEEEELPLTFEQQIPEKSMDPKTITKSQTHISQPTKATMYEIPTQIEEEEEDDDIEPWYMDEEQLQSLPKPEALQAGFFQSTMNRKKQQRIHFAEHAYSPKYTRMLLKMTKEKLSDPKYQWVYFHWNTDHHRFWVSMQGNVQYVELSKQLAYTLGFDTQRLYHGHVAKYMPDIAGGVRQIVVYAPKLVENSVVGNVLAPILRVVNVEGYSGESISTIYTTEHHFRLLGKRHPEITIELRTLTGKLIKFHWGNCVLTLHFQRALF